MTKNSRPKKEEQKSKRNKNSSEKTEDHIEEPEEKFGLPEGMDLRKNMGCG